MTRTLSERQKTWLGRFGLLARFASVQMVIQVLGFLSGVLIVRNLSKPEYAWFTIVNTFVAAMSMLADSGIGGAASAIGGEVWQDSVRLGSLVRTALAFRRKLALVSAAVVTPLLIWMLTKNQAPPETVAALVPAALAGFAMQTTAGVLGVVIALRQQIKRMQVLGLAVAVVRLGVVAPACLVFIDARVAVVAGTLAFTIQAWLLQRWVKAQVMWDAPVSEDYRKRMIAMVKQQAPLTLLHSMQGQIMVLLISIFGDQLRVAEVGALGRFAILFTLISSTTNGIVVPRFARCQDRSVLRRRYLQVAVGFASLAAALVSLSAAFPQVPLWVIGLQYANLRDEVWLMMLSAALGALFACLFSLTYSKGWIVPAVISVPVEIATQLALILAFDLSTVRGVLLVGCLGQVPAILLNLSLAYRELSKPS